MKETKAPEGYSVNQNDYTVTVSASYGSDKTLTSYNISITDQEGTVFMNKTYTATPDADGTDCAIPNTAFMDLPATGGTGTLIFTIAGMIAVTGGTMLLMSKRKGSEG
jgi:LPXTG-motif cell wall-anchored protein